MAVVVYSVSLTHGTLDWPALRDKGVSWSYLLTFSSWYSHLYKYLSGEKTQMSLNINDWAPNFQRASISIVNGQYVIMKQ